MNKEEFLRELTRHKRGEGLKITTEVPFFRMSYHDIGYPCPRVYMKRIEQGDDVFRIYVYTPGDFEVKELKVTVEGP